MSVDRYLESITEPNPEDTQVRVHDELDKWYLCLANMKDDVASSGMNDVDKADACRSIDQDMELVQRAMTNIRGYEFNRGLFTDLKSGAYRPINNEPGDGPPQRLLRETVDDLCSSISNILHAHGHNPENRLIGATAIVAVICRLAKIHGEEIVYVIVAALLKRFTPEQP